MTEEKNYGADNITILEGMDAVRKRPGMYIGDTYTRGYHHLVFETVDNSIDEAMAGHCSKIIVIINPDGSCTVEDNGRGIPIDIHKDTGTPALEVILTTLHAGGKFDDNTYKVSGGLHGVGVSCVNALSERLDVEIYRDGHINAMSFSCGRVKSPLKKLAATKKRGTKITFLPDRSLFECEGFKYDILANRLREMAFLNRGVYIELKDERNEQSDTFHYEGGIVSFVEHLNRNKEPIHAEVLYFEKEEGGVSVEVSMQYNTSFSDNILSFANNINTHEGGTHLAGFRSALTRTLNRYATKNNLAKRDELPSGDDYREGLTAVVSVKLPEPQFEGQTKTKLGNSEIQGMVESIVNDALGDICETKPAIAKSIIRSAIQAGLARKAAKKARELTRRKGAMDVGNLPGKLADCSSKDVNSTEIFIVEGDSAGGSAKQGRDRKFQAILPIKGKILNVEKARIDKMLSHDEIKHMIIALGTSIGEDDFNIEKIRYKRVIIMTDADHDGSHIRTLLMTFFFRHMRPLVEKGFLYVAQPPLYKVKRGRKEQYVFDEAKMETIFKEYGCEKATLKIGEQIFSDEELKDLYDHIRMFMRYDLNLRKSHLDLSSLLRRAKNGEVAHYRACWKNEVVYLNTKDDLSDFVSKVSKSEGHEMEIIENVLNDDFGIALIEILESDDIAKSLKTVYEKFNIESSAFTAVQNDANLVEFIVDGNTTVLKTVLELAEHVRENGRKGIEVQRYKGLGEMNPDQLDETTMNPEKRILKRVVMEDVVKADQLFTLLMGSEVEPRRDYITKHCLDVTNLDV